MPFCSFYSSSTQLCFQSVSPSLHRSKIHPSQIGPNPRKFSVQETLQQTVCATIQGCSGPSHSGEVQPNRSDWTTKLSFSDTLPSRGQATWSFVICSIAWRSWSFACAALPCVAFQVPLFLFLEPLRLKPAVALVNRQSCRPLSRSIRYHCSASSASDWTWRASCHLRQTRCSDSKFHGLASTQSSGAISRPFRLSWGFLPLFHFPSPRDCKARCPSEPQVISSLSQRRRSPTVNQHYSRTARCQASSDPNCYFSFVSPIGASVTLVSLSASQYRASLIDETQPVTA